MSTHRAGSSGVQRLLLSHSCSALAMSMPWPGLLVAVWNSTHSNTWLSIAGGARMAPYVLISWLAGSLADRPGRDRLLRGSAISRAILLSVAAVSLLLGHCLLAVATAAVVVALGTPAFPTIAASLPRLAGDRCESVTGLLVTIEVAAFVLGASLGGAVLAAGPTTHSAVVGLTVLASGFGAAGYLLLRGVRLPDVDPAGRDRVSQPRVALCLRLIARTPSAVQAITAVVVVNAVVGLAGVALLPLAERDWHSGAASFGTATAALGFGVLLGPLTARWLGLTAGRLARSLALTAAPLMLVAAAPSVVWAVAPLMLAGAASVQVETGSTTTIQRDVPSHLQGSALGVVDALIVGGGLLGATSAPVLANTFGAAGVIAVAGLCTAAIASSMSLLPRMVATRRRTRRGQLSLRTRRVIVPKLTSRQ